MKIKNWSKCLQKISMILLLAMLFMPACTTTAYVNPDAEDKIGGTGIDSQDIRFVTKKMCKEILKSSVIRKSATRPKIEIVPLKNSSRFRINCDIFTTKIRNNLISNAGGRISFLATQADRKHVERIRMKNARALPIRTSKQL